MIFWILMLLVVEIIPFILYKFGRLYLTNPPKDRKDPKRCRAFGADKTDETMEFAHRLCGELWFKAGFYLMMLVVVTLVIVIAQPQRIVRNTALVVLAFEVFTVIRSVFIVHKRLKTEFDENGHRITGEFEVKEKNKDLYM